MSKQVRPKILLLLSTLFLLIQCALNKPSDYKMDATFTSESPIIDGIENDSIWQ